MFNYKGYQMNLELIKKYEKEFLHMLHGGKLKYFTGKEWLTYSGVELWTASNDLKIIIDDQYVEFRKALADGKTIEYYTIANYKYPITRMDELEVLIKANHSGKYIFRIKPEEPEFKIGDYVRYIHANSPKPLQISNINCERYYFENVEIILRIDEIEKWEPKEDEVCVFWNNNSNTAVIAKLRYIVNTDTYRTEHGYWDNCMPFTGILPPHMKDNK